jgi:PIN domain nuclease of toxin-antitoxin system
LPYSLDTSAFLDAWVRYYPPDVFPGIWESMDHAAKSGVLVTSDEVLNELSKKDDGAHEWVKSRSVMVVAFDSEIELHVREIMTRYPRLVDSKKGRSVGDPFVIALARAKGLTVITGENPTRKIDVPRIPDVCEDLDIRWIGVLGFFREQGWRL